MKTQNCSSIRREIEEANLDARLTREAGEHLSKCVDCRRFRDDQQRLRGLMAELETVSAPADFDFRLRARLAREKPVNGFRRLLLNTRPITAALVIVLFAVVAVVVRNRMSAASQPPLASLPTHDNPSTKSTDSSIKPAPSTVASIDNSKATVAALGDPVKSMPVKSTDSRRHNLAQKIANSSVSSGQRSGIRESAVTGAVVTTPGSPGTLVVVPIDERAFTLSIDNGRGGARTISLPPVSFGSQPLLAGDASLVPVSSRKGNW
jgi:hypothetical protein